MPNFTLSYLGDLRCQVIHEPSGGVLNTDAPKDNHGKGESFSPTDLTCVALATCMSTVMGISAKANNIALVGFTAKIEKQMSPNPPRRIFRIIIRFTMPSGINRRQRSILEEAAHTCPVALSLHPDVYQDVQFQYPEA